MSDEESAPEDEHRQIQRKRERKRESSRAGVKAEQKNIKTMTERVRKRAEDGYIICKLWERELNQS